MNQRKNQGNAPQGLLEGIQGEVSAESAPLLQFITKYAGAIAGVVLLLLLILGGMAVWNWYHNSQRNEALAKLALIEAQPAGADKERALEELAKSAPGSAKLYAYLSLAQSAQANGNNALAASAYAEAGSLDPDGAIGGTAKLGEAASLLRQNEYAKALAILQEYAQKKPELAQSAHLRQMIAETALLAGNKELALKTYRALAADLPDEDGAYFESRANELEKKDQEAK